VTEKQATCRPEGGEAGLKSVVRQGADDV
jgi:hypothetical protein